MIKSLTSLRGIFILFIFFHHAGVYAGGGSMAVAFFFVLSGFSMTLGYKDRIFHPGFSYKQYLLKRCIKFYPLHWITLFLDIPLVFMSTIHWWLIPVFFINAALFQTLIPIKDIYFSFNAVSWFLADILFFATVFPFVFKWIYKKSTRQNFWVGISLLFIYALIALLIPNEWMHGILYVSPFVRIFDFIFGIYLALFYLNIKDSSIIKTIFSCKALDVFLLGFLIFLLVVESFYLNSTLQMIAPLYWPLIAILILCASLPQNNELMIWENRAFIRLGELSFTIFLVHRLVLRYTSKLLVIENMLLYIVFCLGITIILSLLTDRYILNPITQWLTKKIQPSMTVRS